jgi:hypothetical protein
LAHQQDGDWPHLRGFFMPAILTTLKEPNISWGKPNIAGAFDVDIQISQEQYDITLH